MRQQRSNEVRVEPSGETIGIDEVAPDGGLRAWLTGELTSQFAGIIIRGWRKARSQPAASNESQPGHKASLTTTKFLGVTWGIINSFGAFQPYYVSLLDRRPSDVSWIGSFEVFLLFFIGTFTGRMTDGGYLRPLLAVGSALLLLGIFTTSVCRTYWQFFLAQGVCMGLGNGCLFCPSMAVISTYFKKRRALAMGLAASGSVTGGMIYPSMVRQLLPGAGFAWTMRAIGFVQMATLVVAGSLLKSRIRPRTSGPLVDWSAFAERDYSMYVLGCFMCYFGVYFAFYYLASFGRDVLDMSAARSLDLLLVLNGVSAIGRILPNYIADSVGPVTMYIPLAFVTGVVMYCWMAVESATGLFIWAAVYGIWTGGVQSMFPAGISSLTLDPSMQGTRLGMAFTIISFATLAGQPVSGAIIDAQGGSYLGAQIFAGTCMVGGAVMFSLIKIHRASHSENGWKVKV